MTAKQYLGEYKVLLGDLESLADEIKSLRIQAESIGAMKLDVVGRVSISKIDSSAGFTDIVHNILNVEDMMKKKSDEIAQRRTDIEKCLDLVDDPIQRTLLRMRYVNGYSINEIAEKLNYCIRNVHRLHKLALKAVDDIISCHTIAQSNDI